MTNRNESLDGSTRIPRVLWMLWMQGWESAPPLVQACLRSWQSRNPTWTIHALTAADVGDYVDLAATYPSADTTRISPAALSDMIRIALLAEHGGVWTDSTVFCATPLDHWIDDCSPSGFFAFSRPGPDRMLSSWFLASLPHHPLTVELRDRAREYWRDRSVPDHYFWLHRLFAEAYSSNGTVRRIWDATPKLRSDGPHYFVPYRSRLAGRMTHRARARVMSGADPVYKLSHRTRPAAHPQETAYDFFLRRAACLPVPQRPGPGARLLLLVDRVGERLRWAFRHLVLGMRALAADLLRALGVRRQAGPKPARGLMRPLRLRDR